jgi:hypothetical protein
MMHNGHKGTDRRMGIPGIVTAPWDEHFCVFFKTKAERLSLVVPL